MATGRVEQVTAIHRFNIMEFRTGCSLVTAIDRWPLYRVAIIAGSTVIGIAELV